VLTLTDGTYSARFDLTGTSATHYTVTSDGHGGTLIATGAAAMFVHAMASFGPAPGPSVASGGSVSSGASMLTAAVDGSAAHLHG